MSPEMFVDCIDLSYLGDAISYDEVLAIVQSNESSKAERITELEQHGYPCYTTSAGWLGYPDDKMRLLCQSALDRGFKHLKFKVGRDLEDDKRRLRIALGLIILQPIYSVPLHSSALTPRLSLTANLYLEPIATIIWIFNT